MKPNTPEFRDLVEKLTNSRISLPPLVTKSSAKTVQKKGIVGVKDVDLKILQELNDKDLFSFCLADTYVNKTLCRDEYFWRARFVKRFGEMAAKYKPNDRSWRNHYLQVVQDISVDNRWEFFNDISWTLRENPEEINFFERFSKDEVKIISLKDAPEKIKNRYWLMELGKEIKLFYQIDRYEEMEPLERIYKNDKDFTPAEVIRLIYNFYQEPLSRDELEEMQEAGAEYADEYTLEDAEQGKVKRIDLMGGLIYFEGIRKHEDGYIISLGS